MNVLCFLMLYYVVRYSDIYMLVISKKQNQCFLAQTSTARGKQISWGYGVAVSYTHLDVYKRQGHTLPPPLPAILHFKSVITNLTSKAA